MPANLPAIRLPIGGVIALDLSSRCGWAYGRPGVDRLPWFGVWHLDPERNRGEGGRFAAFENELAAMMEIVQPVHMVIESTIPLIAMAEHSTYGIACQQITLRGIAIMEAYRASCGKSEIDARTVRQEVLGAGWGLRRQDAKAAALRWCRDRKLAVPDDNAADAILVWEWHRRSVCRVAPVAGPLYREPVH